MVLVDITIVNAAVTSLLRIRKLEFARRLVIGLGDDVCGFR
jgi:hypothetical protein